MNTKEYIESGILEQYVLGTVSAQEKQEVECMSHIYPEIEAELFSLQSVIESLAMSSKRTPPPHLKGKILASLSQLSEDEKNSSPLMASSTSGNMNESELKSPVDNNSPRPLSFTVNALRIAAAILLLASLGLAYSLFNLNKSVQLQSNEVSAIKKELQLKEQLIATQSTYLQISQDSSFRKVYLAGIKETSPDSKASIYWNKKTNEVYLSVAKLPKPAEDKQYQLWAIAEGKPVDMGMVSENQTETIFQKMKMIGNAQAFAITLEKKGGVSSPTLAAMYVMGGV